MGLQVRRRGQALRILRQVAVALGAPWCTVCVLGNALPVRLAALSVVLYEAVNRILVLLYALQQFLQVGEYDAVVLPHPLPQGLVPLRLAPCVLGLNLGEWKNIGLVSLASKGFIRVEGSQIDSLNFRFPAHIAKLVRAARAPERQRLNIGLQLIDVGRVDEEQGGELVPLGQGALEPPELGEEVFVDEGLEDVEEPFFRNRLHLLLIII